MTASPAPSAAPCPCLSGLRADRCCALDGAFAQLAAAPAGSLAGVRNALAAGDLVEAERRLVEHLEAFPMDGAALGLLADLRASQGRTAAVEALLARLLRIAPNDLAATQALAMRLFQRGALDEAEVHARNAVRIAPEDAQSHNLMGMILTEAHRPQTGEYHYRRVLELAGASATRSCSPTSPGTSRTRAGWTSRAGSTRSPSRWTRPSCRPCSAGRGWRRPTANFARAAELLDAPSRSSPAIRASC